MPVEALMRAVLALFEKVVKLSRTMPEDAYVAAHERGRAGLAGRPDRLVGARSTWSSARRSWSTADPVSGCRSCRVMLAKELDVLDLESRSRTEVQKEVDKIQREYYLREQMKAIQQELGEDDPQTRETDELRAKIEAAGMPEEVQKKAAGRAGAPAAHAAAWRPKSASSAPTWTGWSTLPWTQQTADHLDI